MVHVYMHGDHATLIFECSTRRSGKISHEKMFIFLKTSIHQFLPSPNKVFSAIRKYLLFT